MREEIYEEGAGLGTVRQEEVMIETPTLNSEDSLWAYGFLMFVLITSPHG